MRHLTADDRCGHRRRLVAMAYDRIDEVSFCELALRGGETALLLRPKLQSGAQCTVSPDAEWISCATRGAHEDLVLLRSGAWNYWWIRTDGSDLRQITAFFDFNGGVIPPDGKQVALNADYKGLVVVDLNVGKPVDWNSVKALPEPEGYSEAMFGPAAWSPDGLFIAGFETGTSGRAEGYAIYDLTEESLRRLDLTADGRAVLAGWLPDSRNLVLRGPAGIAIYDTVAGTTRTILAESDFSSLGLARQGEAPMIQDERLDPGIWLLEFE